MKKQNKKWIWIGITMIILIIIVSILGFFLIKYVNQSIIGSKMVCNSNSDCYDGSTITPDLCINPGKVTSYCSNNIAPD